MCHFGQDYLIKIAQTIIYCVSSNSINLCVGASPIAALYQLSSVTMLVFKLINWGEKNRNSANLGPSRPRPSFKHQQSLTKALVDS